MPVESVLSFLLAIMLLAVHTAFFKKKSPHSWKLHRWFNETCVETQRGFSVISWYDMIANIYSWIRRTGSMLWNMINTWKYEEKASYTVPPFIPVTHIFISLIIWQSVQSDTSTTVLTAFDLLIRDVAMLTCSCCHGYQWNRLHTWPYAERPEQI